MAKVDIIDVLNKPPKVLRVVIMLLIVGLSIGLTIYLQVIPKKKEIEKLNTEIAAQENDIRKSEQMVARLDELKEENRKLLARLGELNAQLPNDREISELLREVSNLGKEAGLDLKFWKPANYRTHPSNIVYEVPVNMEVTGSYHKLGVFYSSLTRVDRIVNITDIDMGSPKPAGNEAQLKVRFSFVTFTAIDPKGIASTAQGANTGAKK